VRIGLTRHLRRAYPVIDLVEAVAARRAAAVAIARHRPRVVIYSATTAALLAPATDTPYAVRLDGPAALNRPGGHNTLQHRLERRRLRAARLVLPWSRAAADALPSGTAPAIVVPPPIAPAPTPDGPREAVAVAYTPDPKAKGLDLVCAAWARAAPPGAHLEVFGVDPARARAFLARRGLAEPPAVRWRGMTAASDFRAALRRARALVCGARWEDFGMAPLEALADGALLVTTPARGAYAALPIARALQPALVASQTSAPALAAAVSTAFALDADARAYYRARARAQLAPFAPAAVEAIVGDEVLPRLLAAATDT